MKYRLSAFIFLSVLCMMNLGFAQSELIMEYLLPDLSLYGSGARAAGME